MDYSKDTLLTEAGMRILKDRYLTDSETSPQQAFKRVADTYSDDSAMAERIYKYVSNLWFMYATPILTNGGTKRGMPISCFLNYVPDSREGLTEHYTENAWLASVGGGIGGFWGHIRSDGTKTSGGSQSSGSIPFMHVVDSEMLAFSQGKTRRGSYATYQDISHPEIEEFIEIRKPSGGDVHRKCLNLHHGIVVTDEFMNVIDECTRNPGANDDWDLIDPHTKKIVRTVSARKLWQKILETRVATGEPYIFFKDTVHQSLPETQKQLGLKVHHSNLCSEITLPTNEERTAVCCLSSINLEKYDEWKDDPYFVPDLVRFLDNVLEYFINNATDFLSRAKFSASQERSIGLGTMGFHSYLQSKKIPFASALAKGLNLKIFKHIKSQAEETSKNLALQRGEAPDMRGTGMRNAHLLAVAPNANSSIICGCTPSIEPVKSNAYVHRTRAGSHLIKNRYLKEELKNINMDTPEVWTSIITNGGSVQHLDFINDSIKEVFKTAIEIDQREIIKQGGDRQQYLCQGQSLNVYFPSGASRKYLHDVHFLAWREECKGLYYLRTETSHRAENVSEKVKLNKLKDYSEDSQSEEDCEACQG